MRTQTTLIGKMDIPGFKLVHPKDVKIIWALGNIAVAISGVLT